MSLTDEVAKLKKERNAARQAITDALYMLGGLATERMTPKMLVVITEVLKLLGKAVKEEK